MLFRFRRMRAMDPLQVAMTGVRMGERYLQLFCSDDTLTRGLATKTGLSGVAALAATDEEQARRARKAAGKAGVLIDITVGPATALEWPDDSFDMVVVDDTGAHFSGQDDAARHAMLIDARRVLRPGGRVEFIERLPGGGLFGAPPPADATPAAGVESALTAAGFRPVRTLAERDGFRFVEGLNPGPPQTSTVTEGEEARHSRTAR